MKLWEVKDNPDDLRGYFILIRHYFPQVDIKDLSDEEFGIIANDALWLHKQKAMLLGARLVQ